MRRRSPISTGAVRRAPRRSPEFDEQAALIAWCRIPANIAHYPGLDLISASLNGVKLSKAQAGKAKAAGMLAGEHDLRIPVPRGGYVGLVIEMKANNGRPTTAQLWYGERMEAEGHCVRYAWTWPEAKDAIVEYLSLPRRT
ncbi:hypothetical protein F1_00030 [Ralstonia phage Heva]|uniref:VRR-NUC domain-containing protein n=3 Tax=Cimandefvirus TaxID=2843366 RepID=A0A7G5BAS0_9CAUD|nr:hypothetical protein KMC44_gp59 [Ralstonia phage Cimandef]YP_010078267.1 hypothetical protein KMC45_gp03 [Ralstonia phage Eline]YP_010078500.1 hypothetical protein KMC48_gp60 [Ralstonia phage Heva]QMV32829.1 hypothetical protein D1_00003 [Ralstonia phage Dimitile]QMV32656.1 hypothetical protein B2_00022 [Ralstonia phage Cimandef]QMV33006.1 hypothetical protein 3Fb_00003 [Ralstonia phage Eline]QMV33393.1 hypothetical protein F1_00030 [Ralstonia phage Heva]